MDSAFVAGTNSNEKGAFRLEKVKPGDHRLAISYLGYETAYVSVLGMAAIRNYSDRRIAFPTEQQKNTSSNGINLLNSLMLPRLQINPITNAVTLPNEGVIQLCINGVKVEPSDIRALAPKDIVRVEYHDNPGLRYGNADVVLDYVVKRETAGGTIHLDLSNSPVNAFGDDQASVRLNHKKSEFGLQYATRYRFVYKMMQDRLETYRLTIAWSNPINTTSTLRCAIPVPEKINIRKAICIYGIGRNGSLPSRAAVRTQRTCLRSISITCTP